VFALCSCGICLTCRKVFSIIWFVVVWCSIFLLKHCSKMKCTWRSQIVLSYVRHQLIVFLMLCIGVINCPLCEVENTWCLKTFHCAFEVTEKNMYVCKWVMKIIWLDTDMNKAFPLRFFQPQSSLLTNLCRPIQDLRFFWWWICGSWHFGLLCNILLQPIRPQVIQYIYVREFHVSVDEKFILVMIFKKLLTMNDHHLILQRNSLRWNKTG
jgi:hypothetical protein